MLRGKFTGMQGLSDRKYTHINNLTLNLKNLKNYTNKKPKVTESRKIIKIKAEINESD